MRYYYLAFAAFMTFCTSCSSETGTTATPKERAAIEEFFGDFLPASVDGYISSDTEAESFNAYTLRLVNGFSEKTAHLSMEERVRKQVELSCYFMSFIRMPEDTITDWESLQEKRDGRILDSMAVYLQPVVSGQDSFYLSSVNFSRTLEGMNFTFTHRYAEQKNWIPQSQEHQLFMKMMKEECPRSREFHQLYASLQLYPYLKSLGHID